MIRHTTPRMAVALLLISLLGSTVTAQAVDSPVEPPVLHEHTQGSSGNRVVSAVPTSPGSSFATMRDDISAPECDGQPPAAGALRSLLKRFMREPMVEEARLCVMPPEEETAHAQHD